MIFLNLINKILTNIREGKSPLVGDKNWNKSYGLIPIKNTNIQLRPEGQCHDWEKIFGTKDGRKVYMYKCKICGEMWKTYQGIKPEIEYWYVKE